MALTVNTNIPALNAQRNLGRTQNALAQALKRLSSGLRINSAKDDAAGLAISSRMTSQIRGLNQAVRNANDGISLAQTAEGAMQEMTSLLQRMRELAVQAANDTNSAGDRASIQNEVDQLYAELDRIAATSQFNNVQLLDGTGGSHTFQIGAYSGETLAFEISGVTTEKLALNSYTGTGELNGGRTLSAAFTVNEGDVLINGFKLFGTGDESFTSANGAQEIAEAINDNTGLHSITASSYNVLKGNAGVDGVTSGLTINADTVTQSGSMQELVDNVNRDVSGATATLNADGSITVSNDTGDDIVVGGTVTGSGLTGVTAGTIYTGYISLNSPDGEAIELSLTENQTSSTVTDLQNMGFNLSTGSSLATGAAVGTPTASSIALTEAMDIQINGVEIGKSAGNSASDKADAINSVIDETAVRATGATQLKVELNMAAGVSADTIAINGTSVDLTGYGSGIDLADVVTGINASGIQGVAASANEDGNLILTSDTGLNITVADVVEDFFGAVTDQSGNAVTNVDSTGDTFYGNLTLESETGVDVIVDGDDVAELGYTAQGGNEEAIGRGLSVNSVANASAAIDAIDIAIATVSGVRGQLGSIQTRFESTIANLTSVSENVSAARSRIVDADFALETAAFTKSQIMQQAGIAMLAQANMLPQTVLSLLQ